jgi:hypothetical protein
VIAAHPRQQQAIEIRRQRLLEMEQARQVASLEAAAREEQHMATRRARSAVRASVKVGQSRGQQVCVCVCVCVCLCACVCVCVCP